jgi:hypothetical protein
MIYAVGNVGGSPRNLRGISRVDQNFYYTSSVFRNFVYQASRGSGRAQLSRAL